MLKNIIITSLTIFYLYADNINKNILDEEQRKIYNEQQKNNIILENNILDKNYIRLRENENDKNCIQIDKVNILGSTVFSKKEFSAIIKPYINKCNGFNKLSNLRDEISNMYINKGYITSRAYIKPQDLSSGVININIMEGKVDNIIEEGINTSNLYSYTKEKKLNLKDLEIAIQQGDRLKSQSLNFELIPADKVGFSNIKIKNKNTDNPFYGSISSNNFGNKKTGRYQISANFNYENLFNISDIITLNANSTDNLFQSNDNNLGNSISYSVPLYRYLFSLEYSYFKYKQLNKDIFENIYQSNGDTKSLIFTTNYKLYYSKRHTFDLKSSFMHKKTKNSLNDVDLELQTYNLSVLNLGYKHSYLGNTFDYYSKLTISKGLNILDAKNSFAEHKADFLKYVLDLSFNKYFTRNFIYNLSFRGQYSSDYLYGTEEISMGGPYSVRGFKKGGLVGNSGFYTRNDFSYTFNYAKSKIIPYLGLDYGYVTDDNNNIYGNIIGSAIGNKIFYKNLFFEIFYTIPLKDNEYTKNSSDNFFGINVSYNY